MAVALLFIALPLAVQLATVFVVGAAIGSFLNVCIYRLPLEKSLIWPGSRCGQCLQPVRWYDNIPLLSYWLLGGRCRVCGKPFSVRYFLIELLTALGLVGLYYLEVVENVHELDEGLLGQDRFDVGRLAIFGYHAVLFCYLLVASGCDLDHQTIPLPLTVTGTIVGLAGSVLWPWPWPYTPAEATRGILPGQPWWTVPPAVGPKTGLYPWPVWGPLPGWLQPGGNWQTGLATGVAGLLAGTVMLRAVRLLFGLGVGADYMEPADPEAELAHTWFARRWLSWLQRLGGKALGLGDADLMMMAGSFLGWQPVAAAFFIGVFPGLAFGIAQWVVRGNQPMPFGPSLAIGVVITWLAWQWIGPQYQMFFFNGTLVVSLVVISAVGMLFAAYVLRMLRLMRR